MSRSIPVPGSPMFRLLEARRKNLRIVVEQFGGAAATAKLLGHANRTFLPQLIGPNPRRDISERLARSIEEKLGLQLGALDIFNEAESAEGLLAELHEAFLSLLNELGPVGLRTITEQQFADLCAALLAQHREAGRVSASFIQRLVRLTRGVA